MAKAKHSVPEGFHAITPHLCVNDAAAAIAFYQKAFGAEEVMRMPSPEGKIMHAEVRIGNSPLMLNDEYPEMGNVSAKAIGKTAVTLHLYVPNVDKVYDQAVKAGATALMPVTDMFWGDRYGQVMDPFGHRWAIATHTEDLTPEEIGQRAAKEFSAPG